MRRVGSGDARGGLAGPVAGTAEHGDSLAVEDQMPEVEAAVAETATLPDARRQYR
ncbi:hypothetical protein [Nocardia sp. SC052]|uniref:hypothetical protein n=1 Tax=Nocardia sichangensis TaxID=3385975 RepID=UPI0039A0C193